MFGQNVDIGKVLALKKAGWGMESIAIEMGIEPEEVEDAIARYAEQDKGEREHIQEGSIGEGGETLVVLSWEQLEGIYEKAASIGAKEALKVMKQENSRRADRRLRNTQLLLRNYHMLKEHAQNSVFGRTQMEESAIDILESMMSMYDNEVIIESIKRSATRTAIIVSHIDTMFGLYHSYCDNTSNRDISLRRYGVEWDTYMADRPLPAKEVAKKYSISTRTVYEDIKIATEGLSALIFGVDGLNVH